MEVKQFNKNTDMAMLPEFAHYRRFWMPQHERYGVKVVAGDFYVSTQDELITTVLGSCVSACIRDPKNGVGGINHFLLPDADCDLLSASNRYGVFAMEQLINAIIKHGGRRENFEVKLVGGGNMIAGSNDIGQSNIEFVKNFLRTEGYRVVAEDLGGIYPRKILYNITSGKLLVNKLKNQHQDSLAQQELAQQRSRMVETVDDDVELFD